MNPSVCTSATHSDFGLLAVLPAKFSVNLMADEKRVGPIVYQSYAAGSPNDSRIAEYGSSRSDSQEWDPAAQERGHRRITRVAQRVRHVEVAGSSGEESHGG